MRFPSPLGYLGRYPTVLMTSNQKTIRALCVLLAGVGIGIGMGIEPGALPLTLADDAPQVLAEVLWVDGEAL